MGDCSDQRKRVRDDSEVNSPETKIARVDSDSELNSSATQLSRVNSGESCVNSVESELGRVDSDNTELDSPGSREIQDHFLDILDDADNVAERDLDSVIKSFEEEILAPAPDPNTAPESNEIQPNLGYLLEASDDELGLPPTVKSGGEEKSESADSGRVGPEGVDLSGFMGFDDDVHISEYGSMGFGTGVDSEYCNGGSGFVMLDGIFDYAEPTDILWQLESLQAM